MLRRVQLLGAHASASSLRHLYQLAAIGLAFLCTLSLVACAETLPATAVVVSVKSEVEEVTTLRITITDTTSGKANNPELLPTGQSPARPISFTVAPPLDQTRAGFLITVEGLDRSNISLVSVTATAEFILSQTQLMTLRLTKMCKGATCGPQQTCQYEPGDRAAGECGAILSPHLFVFEAGDDNDLSFFTPAAAAQGPDGGEGAKPDAFVATPHNGANDAGRDAGSSTPGIDSGDVDGSTGDAGVDSGGACCPSGNCLCRGPAPTQLTSEPGSYQTATVTLSTGTAYYPADATPPFAALALSAGFGQSDSDLADWATFYASHGIVALLTTTDPNEQPDARGRKLLASIAELKTVSVGPLAGKLSGRYGVSGVSMGGGGALLAAASDATLLTSVALAPWIGNSSAAAIRKPNLILCSDADGAQPCGEQADVIYADEAATTPKMKIAIAGAVNQWTKPTAGAGNAGQYALAFQKVFLEGDERWRSLLLTMPTGASVATTIR